MGLNKRTKKTYLSVSNGRLRRKAEEGEEGATKRTVKRDDGSELVISEMVFDSLSGSLADAKIVKGTYGEQLMLLISDVEEFSIYLSMNSPYASDFIRKFNNIDLSKEVELVPYSFEVDGFTNNGITIYQLVDGDRIKLSNYFINVEADKSGKKKVTYLHGYPKRPEGELDESDAKIYKIQRTKFLKEFFNNEILPKFSEDNPSGYEEPEQEQEVDEDDLPF